MASKKLKRKPEGKKKFSSSKVKSWLLHTKNKKKQTNKRTKKTETETENPDSLFDSSSGKTNSLFVSNIDNNI